MNKCDKCNGTGLLNLEGEKYTSWIAEHYKATVIGCYKDINKGKVLINFGIKDLNMSKTMEIPIEYFYMMTGQREFDLTIDEDGNRKK